MAKVRALVRPSNGGGNTPRDKRLKPGTREWMIRIRPPAPAQKHRLGCRLSDEEVGERVAQLRALHPHLQPKDEPLVSILAASLIKAEAARAWQNKTWFMTRSHRGILAFQPFEQQLRALEAHILKYSHALGITPEARFLLKIPHEKDVPASLETIRAQFTVTPPRRSTKRATPPPAHD